MTNECIYILDDPRLPGAFAGVGEPLRSASAIRTAAEKSASKAALWVASRPGALLEYLQFFRETDARLLLLSSSVQEAELDLIRTRFRCVLWRSERLEMLPVDEIADVLREPFPEDYVIAAESIPKHDALILFRGDLSQLSITGKELIGRPLGDAALSLDDSGQSIRIGEIEVAVSTILYERDRAFRKRYRANRVKEDSSFGGSLRRLRLLRGLSRSELGVTEKEIARIERGEVEKPHKETLRTIARRLKVQPSEIESY